MKLRVDTVPTPLRPAYLLASGALAAGILGGAALVRLSCKVTVAGGALEGPAAVYCCWHDAFVPLVCARVGRRLRRHAWMNHPGAQMKPIHLVIEALGARVVLGSSGHGGREAAAALVQALRAGESTVVLVDGPFGPRHVLKRGALHIAAEAGVPVVPVRVVTSRVWELGRTWDKKRIPLPFSSLRVEVGAPLAVTDPNDASVAEQLVAGL